MSDNRVSVMEMAASVSSAATKTTYAGAASGFLAYLAAIDVLAWLGIAIALGGFFVNWYYKRLENKRANELHQLKINQYHYLGNDNVKQD